MKLKYKFAKWMVEKAKKIHPGAYASPGFCAPTSELLIAVPERIDQQVAWALPYNLESALADYAHRTWSSWMQWMFSKCYRGSAVRIFINDDEQTDVEEIEGLLISDEFVDRWERQMNTSYGKLSPKEQASDINEAKRIIDVINSIC